MDFTFYLAATVAVIATALVITQANAVHALLYLIVSLLAVATIFFTLGAPLVAALEIIIYAGAIMVLFVFVVMLLNLGPPAVRQERRWLEQAGWIGPGLLGAILLGEMTYLLFHAEIAWRTPEGADPKAVAVTLFGPYLIAVELASLLLLSGLVGAYHLGRGEFAEAIGKVRRTEDLRPTGLTTRPTAKPSERPPGPAEHVPEEPRREILVGGPRSEGSDHHGHSSS